VTNEPPANDDLREHQLRGLCAALDTLLAQGIVAQWQAFPSIGLVLLCLNDNLVSSPVVFTADQVEAFVVGARAGLRVGMSSCGSSAPADEWPRGPPGWGSSLDP